MTSGLTVLLTGAQGFIGTPLTLALLDAGYAVRCASRAKSSALRHSIHCSEVLIPSIGSETDWTTALRGVDLVVHLAARVHVMKPTAADRERFYETNVLGTAGLAEAAAASGVRRFVLLSSVKVNGESTTRDSFRADNAPHPQDEYGASKLQAEERLFAIAKNSKMEAVAIRSPLVYGPGVKANFLKLMSWVYRGIPLPFGFVDNRRSMISVWNLCDLIKRVVELPTVSSGVLMASDDDDLSTPDLIRWLARGMGRPTRLLGVPIRLLNAVGLAIGKSGEIMRLCSSLTVDISETKRQLNWTPPLSVDEGLARTAQWYLEEVRAGRA
jgi:nucleoside-diphosphate-sugar epimerase